MSRTPAFCTHEALVSTASFFESRKQGEWRSVRWLGWAAGLFVRKSSMAGVLRDVGLILIYSKETSNRSSLIAARKNVNLLQVLY